MRPFDTVLITIMVILLLFTAKQSANSAERNQRYHFFTALAVTL